MVVLISWDGTGTSIVTLRFCVAVQERFSLLPARKLRLRSEGTFTTSCTSKAQGQAPAQVFRLQKKPSLSEMGHNNNDNKKMTITPAATGQAPARACPRAGCFSHVVTLLLLAAQ